MILRYAANLKLAKELYTASKPKLKGDQEMKDTFQMYSAYQKAQLN